MCRFSTFDLVVKHRANECFAPGFISTTPRQRNSNFLDKRSNVRLGFRSELFQSVSDDKVRGAESSPEKLSFVRAYFYPQLQSLVNIVRSRGQVHPAAVVRKDAGALQKTPPTLHEICEKRLLSAELRGFLKGEAIFPPDNGAGPTTKRARPFHFTRALIALRRKHLHFKWLSLACIMFDTAAATGWASPPENAPKVPWEATLYTAPYNP